MLSPRAAGVCIVAVAVFLVGVSLAAQSPQENLVRLRKTLAEFNRGAALMEQYKYPEAAKAFEQVLEAEPEWTAARFNLGLAYFNMHGMQSAQTNLQSAREAFEKVLAADPGHLHARYCLGLYYQYLGESEKALEQFEQVYKADGEDPHVCYKYAEALIDVGRYEDGTKVLEKVVELDPGFISAVYRLAGQYQRMRQREKAVPLFQRFRELQAAELSGGSFTVGKAYGSAGKYYTVLDPDSAPIPQQAVDDSHVTFSPELKPFGNPAEPWKWSDGLVGLPGIAAGDLDGDGDLDLCMTMLGEQGSTSLWMNDGKGRFSAGQTLEQRGVSPCLGDLDNDGDQDLWLGCAGSDVYLENDGSGHFTSQSITQIQGPSELTHCARLTDIDSDGDLDFLAFRLGGGNVPAGSDSAATSSSVYNNNRDGTFTDIADGIGLSMPTTPVAAVVCDDFDNDWDLDLVIFPAGDATAIAWVNDRVGKFRVLSGAAMGLTARNAVSATSGDPDKDGDRDLLVYTGNAVRLFKNQGRFRFEPDQRFTDAFGYLGGTGGQFADMDNDGDLDIVIADGHRRDGSRGPVLLLNDWPRDRFIDMAFIKPGNLLSAILTKGDASCVVADFTGGGNCDIVLAPAHDQPFVIENETPPKNQWIEIDLLGARKKDQKARSNNSAIGARVEVKTGGVFQQYIVGVPSGPVSMAPLRIHAGLGPNPKVDWLRILWPDAVLQAELELPAGRVTTIAELPRKVSSCPSLFAWNGSRFEFVADFGGVGGLGYAVGPGEYGMPDSTEYLRIPKFEPIGDEYVLQVVAQLEEVIYFDEAKLIAVDHDLGTEVYPNEMMAIGAPPPPFELYCYRTPIDAVSAVDHRGTDVTKQLLHIDRKYAGTTDLDERFIGFAREHFVELDFGERLANLPADSRLVLFLYGWVEYPYSSTNYAASQAGLRAKAPSIHVLRGGKWVDLFSEVGYPAGLEHMMTLDVSGKIVSGDRRIRISSNMEIYWDRVFLARPHGEAAVSYRTVEVADADLHFLGYPREYSPDGHHPNLYDYSNLDRTVAWKLMPGEYTRYGDVDELLDEADDCYIIMAPGDELTLRFPVDAFGPLPEGKTRTFILKTDSYCKDMDLYTACPDSVDPLPFHAMSSYPYPSNERYPDNIKTRSYRQRYNTRRIGRR